MLRSLYIVRPLVREFAVLTTRAASFQLADAVAVAHMVLSKMTNWQQLVVAVRLQEADIRAYLLFLWQMAATQALCKQCRPPFPEESATFGMFVAFTYHFLLGRGLVNAFAVFLDCQGWKADILSNSDKRSESPTDATGPERVR